jgi:ATP-dependent DNA helicase RecQ
MDAKEALKIYFGFDSFKEGQEEIINAILSGHDVLAVMPTGSGKSICYQIPALLLPGITIIISPLISLMQDQVKALNEAGIHAGYINSSLTELQISKVYDYTLNGKFKILYVAPERLESYGFTSFASKADISMVTVDEAHCISQWGQDFRPSYLKIIDFIDSLPKRPIVGAFTATATEEVKNDISCVLKLQAPDVVVTGFDRENLYFSVETIKQKDDYIVEYINKHPQDSGIIYCATRKNVEAVFALLKAKGVQVARYHAGMDNENRMNSQNDFIFDRCTVMVATNAFGMGIDKSNVRFVIHYNMPQSMENYYQEAGRAGRDGEPSQCILLFSAHDIMIARFLLEHKEFTDVTPEDINLIKERDAKRLKLMERYCRTTGCLRNYILNYFGEKRTEPCDNCGNCHREFIETDMTTDAKIVVNCVCETKGKYGISIVMGTLLGANRARLKELGTNNYQTYGVLRNRSEAELRLLINQMILDGYLYQTDEQYSVLRLGDITALKDENIHVIIRTYEGKEPEERISKQSKRSTDALTRAGYELFEILRRLRLTIAREEGLPPYIVFSDKTLIDMSSKAPRDRVGMLHVSGVGAAKYDKYGERFVEVIGVFLDEHPDVITSIRDEEAKTTVRQRVTKKKTDKRKVPFYLKPGDEDKFDYRELYQIGEIKDELNRITSAQNVKHIFGTQIMEFLKTVGYVEEQKVDGRFFQGATELGASKGITFVEKTSQLGTVYNVLVYPISIQKEIVDHYIRTDIEEEEETVEELSGGNVFSSQVAYIRRINRPDGAGASWSKEEDAQLDDEYKAGMKISEMAKIHNRTNGGIRSRLKKHGWDT